MKHSVEPPAPVHTAEQKREEYESRMLARLRSNSKSGQLKRGSRTAMMHHLQGWVASTLEMSKDTDSMLQEAEMHLQLSLPQESVVNPASLPGIEATPQPRPAPASPQRNNATPSKTKRPITRVQEASEDSNPFTALKELEAEHSSSAQPPPQRIVRPAFRATQHRSAVQTQAADLAARIRSGGHSVMTDRLIRSRRGVRRPASSLARLHSSMALRGACIIEQQRSGGSLSQQIEQDMQSTRSQQMQRGRWASSRGRC